MCFCFLPFFLLGGIDGAMGMVKRVLMFCLGSFAARWMASYMGFVPKGSLFSYLQRLGMTLKWKLVV